MDSPGEDLDVQQMARPLGGLEGEGSLEHRMVVVLLCIQLSELLPFPGSL
jgi:hypothetical protein